MDEIANLKKAVKFRDMGNLSSYRQHLTSHPRLTYLFAELTNACNLRCLHCGSHCGGEKAVFIDTSLLLRSLETVAEDFVPRTVMICFTGGEQLLHSNFFHIAEKVVELGFPWGITTNGTLIDELAARKMKALGLHSVTISIDGLEETHDSLRQIPGAFQSAVSAVRRLRDAGVPVQITSVIHSKNFHELKPLYQLMLDLDIASWRVINIEPIGRAEEHRELLLNRDQFFHLLRFIRELRYTSENRMDVCFGCSHYLPLDFEREVRDNYFLCGSGIYVGSILCNGDIFSCLDIPRRPDLIQGNVKDDRFSEVWYHGFREFRMNRTELNEKCRFCSERDFCCADSTHTWNFEENEPKFCMKREGSFYHD